MANSGQKVVLITGCSSGIGLRIAVTLAKDEKKRYHGAWRDKGIRTSCRNSISMGAQVKETPKMAFLICGKSTSKAQH
ncbi:hypothetical protein KUCAC02_007838 [Chaenocephalus aceratus]|uniref:Uncharacterized protein n=1 Tax=Chaenocephalus aceratus TaxID=36190 RepID=A0ACB9X8G9_CHAAC|nr:hypothetical protein KUCAC02_007838 [Chaenocephalus aceratus]